MQAMSHMYQRAATRRMCTNIVNRKVTEHALRASVSEVRVVPLTSLYYHCLICYVSFILWQIPVESIYKQFNNLVIDLIKLV